MTCHLVINALANLYVSLADRGFDIESVARSVFVRWRAIRMLGPSPRYDRICELTYRKFILEEETDIERRLDDAAWLAMHANNFLFVRDADTHRGITYSVVYVVVTPPSGPEAIGKLDRARGRLDMIAKGMETTGRVIRLIVGRAGTNVKKVTFENESVSTETWYTSELQWVPVEHDLVARHQVYAQMTEAEKARLPPSTRLAAEGDSSKLDIILVTDVIARWYGYALGQVICITRRHKFDGGESFHIRRVGQ